MYQLWTSKIHLTSWAYDIYATTWGEMLEWVKDMYVNIFEFQIRYELGLKSD